MSRRVPEFQRRGCSRSLFEPVLCSKATQLKRHTTSTTCRRTRAYIQQSHPGIGPLVMRFYGTFAALFLLVLPAQALYFYLQVSRNGHPQERAQAEIWPSDPSLYPDVQSALVSLLSAGRFSRDRPARRVVSSRSYRRTPSSSGTTRPRNGQQRTTSGSSTTGWGSRLPSRRWSRRRGSSTREDCQRGSSCLRAMCREITVFV